MSVTHFHFNDPLQSLSLQLHSILQLYLEGNAGGYIGSRVNLNLPPIKLIRNSTDALKKIIERNRWEKYFAKTWESYTIEETLGYLFKGFSNLIDKSDRQEQEFLSLDKLKKLSKYQIKGSGYDKKILRDIKESLLRYSEYYKIALLDGSIGSGDYKPGWSDIDIFVVLDNKVLHSPSRLKNARKIALKLRQKIYNYSIVQLHGVFYSTGYSFRYHLDNLFPLECLNNGLNICHDHELILSRPVSDESAFYYFQNHIYNSSRELLSQLPALNTFQKVLLIHRIYSFPFAFLATQGIYQYKRDSFHTLGELYSDLFEGVNQFYNSLNEFYRSWHVDKLRTEKLRHCLNLLFDPRFVNRSLLPLEREIVQNIDQFYQFFLRKECIYKFGKYLETSKRILRIKRQ